MASRLMRRAAVATTAFILVVVQMPMSAQAAATTFTVTATTDDPGASCADPCSLRQAINAANANPGVDTIEFEIPAALVGGAHTISPTSPLPTITEGVTIDATTDADFVSCTDGPIIVLDGVGAGAGATAIGLHITSGASTVKALAISRFAGHGIRLETGGGNTVTCSYLGTDVTGSIARGNQFGIVMFNSANNTIGGEDPGEGNLISGNSPITGLVIQDVGSTGNVVQGNLIGTAADGVSPLGNAFTGVRIIGAASNNTIGGTTAGAGNVIAFNGGAGISIGAGNGNRFLGNSIHDNTDLAQFNARGLGIDLQENGVTANDPGDVDSIGPNRLQNYPVITAATTISITGTLDSTPGLYRLEFSKSASCDPLGNGEGTAFLGALTAQPSGPFIFPTTLGPGDVVTATATNDATGDTSEFSVCATVADGPSLVVNATDDTTDAPGCTQLHCSLREAINRSNDTAGVDTINFSIPGSGPHTISPTSALPTISDPTIIDATTEPGSSCTTGLMIELDGSGVASGHGLRLTGSGSTVQGFVINRFGGAASSGVFVGGSGGHTVRCNWIGTALDGMAAGGNGYGGIEVAPGSHSNTIGGSAPGEGNVVSANLFGIGMFNSNSNWVYGNLVGTSADGDSDLGNVSVGVVVDGGDGNIVGGPGSGQGNTIAGTGGSGLQICCDTASSNTVQGNRIGTNGTGTGAIPNDGGVHLNGGTHHNTIGGAAPGEGNLISGNLFDGVAMTTFANQNAIVGNRIGTAADGVSPLGNTRYGVFLDENADGNSIGGTAAGEGNVIAHNLNDGVVVERPTASCCATDNRILGNSIHSNGGEGIDLRSDGVTPNDPDDPDAGANHLQNFPVINAASGTTVSATLDAAALTTFRIEVFSNAVCDPSGFGEGETLIGADYVPTDGAGDATFMISVSALSPGQIVTATATDPTGNTSEFSACFTSGVANGTITVAKATEPDGSSQTFTFSGAVSGSLGDGHSVSADVAPGSHTVTEAATAGWDLTAIVCDDDDSTVDLATRTATFVVDTGEHVTCGFTNTQQIVDPPPNETALRWCAPRNPDVWIDFTTETCGGRGPQAAPYGTITSGPSGTRYAGTTGQLAFPYVWSPDETFPASGDFVLDVRLRYDAIRGHGDGVHAHRWPDANPAGSNSPYPDGERHCSAFGIWADSAGGARVSFSGQRAPVAAAGSFHDYRLEYVDGKYLVFLDGQLVIGPIAIGSQVQVDRYWIGNPKITDWGAAPWTEFTIARIAVSQPGFIDTDGNGEHDGSQAWTPVRVPANARLDTDTDGLPNHCDPVTSPPVANGTITVAKATEPDGSSQTFTFSGAVSGSLGDGHSVSADVAPGSHTVTEAATAGWDLTAIVCDDDDSTVDLATRTATFVVDTGEHVTCGFTNSVQPGRIVVVKNAVPDSEQDFTFTTGGGLSPATFDLDDNGVETDALPSTWTFDSLAPGSGYSIVETGHDAWTSSVSCDDGSPASNISVSPGETVTCTFVNRPVCITGPVVLTPLPADIRLGMLESNECMFLFEEQSLTVGPGGHPVDASPVIGGANPVLPEGSVVTSYIVHFDDATNGPTISLTGTYVFPEPVLGVIFELGSLDDSDDTLGVPDTAPPTTGLVYEKISDARDLEGSDSYSIAAGGRTVTFNLETQNALDNIRVVVGTLPPGRIVVVKDADPDGATQVFDFQADYDVDGFSLSDGDQGDSGPLDAGTYSVSEDSLSGWDLTSATCDDGSLPSAIALDWGETVTCTFSNQQDAHIIVEKQTNPDGSIVEFDFDAGYDSDGFALSDGESNDSGDLDPGTYSVSESPPANWQQESVSCSDGSTPDSIALAAGETVTCVFINRPITVNGTIIVEKQTLPDGSTQAFDFTAEYDADGFTLIDGQQNVADVTPGTYTISENAITGWDQTSLHCNGQPNSGTVTVAAGETVTCVFTNTQRGRIIIDKVTNPAGDPQWFNFTLTGGPVPVSQSFSLTDAALPQDSGLLRPGTYAVSEAAAPDWSTDSTCNDGSAAGSIGLSAGEVVTCPFTNTRVPANLSILKVVSNATPGLGDNFTYTLTVGNAGPGWARGVVVTDNLSTNLFFISASAGCSTSVVSGVTRVTCALGDLPAAPASGGSRTVSITVDARFDCTHVGTSGNDSFAGTPGADVMCGGGGGDALNGGAGNDFIDGFGPTGAIPNTASVSSPMTPDPNLANNAASVTVTVGGTDGADTIRGGAGADTIVGREGKDRLYGDDDGDNINGGDRGDWIEGGDGNDVLNGDGNAANPGWDTIYGGRGADTINGNAGNDEIHGGDQADDISGGDDNDKIEGDADNDLLDGNAGNDSLSGGGGDDRINGGAGNDKVQGGTGTDILHGNAGDDRVDGGPSPGQYNQLYGDSGTDWCSFGPDSSPGTDFRSSSCEKPSEGTGWGSGPPPGAVVIPLLLAWRRPWRWVSRCRSWDWTRRRAK